MIRPEGATSRFSVNDNTPASAAELLSQEAHLASLEDKIAQGKARFLERFAAWQARKAADAASPPIEVSL